MIGVKHTNILITYSNHVNKVCLFMSYDTMDYTHIVIWYCFVECLGGSEKIQ